MTGSSIVPPAGAAPDPIGPASDELRDLAIAAALAVGPDLRAAFGRTHQVASKANFHDLVTESDAAAEATIRSHLLSGTPAAAIVGEEGGLIGDGLVRWYVDPIDGTNNFASGIPFFCVSIGATVADRLVAGVVYDPIRDELFAASGGIATEPAQPPRFSPSAAAMANTSAMAALRTAGDETTFKSLSFIGFPRPQTASL